MSICPTFCRVSQWALYAAVLAAIATQANATQTNAAQANTANTIAINTSATNTSAAAASLAQQSSPRSFTVRVVGQGRPVLLIPGLMSAPSVWQSTVEALQSDHQLHLIQLAGFAGLPPLQSAQAAPLLTTVQQQLLAYIQNQQLQQPVIIGHSLGGFLAFALASSAPELIGPIISVDGLPYLAPIFTGNPATEPAQMQAQAAQLSAQYQQMTPAQLRQATAAGLFIQATSPAAQQQVLTMASQSDPATVGRAMAEVLTTDLRPQISRIRQPVLLLGASGAVPAAAQDRVKALYQQQLEKLPTARLDINPKVRHFIMLDDPAWLNQQIRNFLAKGDRHDVQP